MTELSHQHVLVLGLGASGLAIARWCTRLGAKVTVADTRPQPPCLETLRKELPQAVFLNAAMDESLLEPGMRAVFKSPGLSPIEVAGVMDAAHKNGLWVGSELSLFSQALSDLKSEQGYSPVVIGITGSNGKTTVTSLTAQLVERSGKRVRMAGNIGPTLLDSLTQVLDNKDLPQVWVLELSSFQLDGVSNFSPTVATVLNISQDHLDWHGDMANYIQAKATVFATSTLRVLNREDPQVMALLPSAVRGKPFQASQEHAHVTFGSNMPQRPGDFGIEHVNGMAWLVRAQDGDSSRKQKKGEAPELFIQRLMPADALRIRGRHNATNALAALSLAQAAGCSLAPILYSLREYRGEPHRLESVGVIDGAEYFDDSKGTNVGATVAAINGLGADVDLGSGKSAKVIVILGGVGKGQDFSALAEPVSRYARVVILIGRDAPMIETALQHCPVELLHANSMEKAVELAHGRAQSGDVVLMSPACASFDMFHDYAHRAQVFCDAVAALRHGMNVLEGGVV